MQTELLDQSLPCFYEYLVALRSVSMPLKASTTTAARLTEKLWKGELPIIIPAVRIGRQCLDQRFLGLFFGLGVMGARTLRSARVDPAYQRVCQLKVLVIIEKESNDDPKQSCVATNLSDDHVQRFDCPNTCTDCTILHKYKDKFVVSYIASF